MWRAVVAAILFLGSCPALADNAAPPVPQPAEPSNPYAAVWLPVAPSAPTRYVSPSPVEQRNWLAPAEAAAAPVAVSADAVRDSTWYFRQDAFWWKERFDGADFVNEHGPLSTLGYLRRSGIERFRIELFGGTVAYDGAGQFDDGTLLPYHQSFGTNYLGCRGEYDLLIEPACLSRVRVILGVGARCWIRDLQNYFPADGPPVIGYQETWLTFYPYVGLETKMLDEPGPRFFGSLRVGATPLNYQHATYFDATVYPRCGLTAQSELGVRFQKFSLSAFMEVMTWGQSAEVMGPYGDYVLQPASQMLTVGGKLSYTF
jgi:hypothetical protein